MSRSRITLVSLKAMAVTLSLLLLTGCFQDAPTADAASGNQVSQEQTQEASSGSAGYQRINAADPDDPLAAHIFELDNGLRVYLTENHQEPRFYAEIAVRAGSKHDPADATGLAHYLEHLLFKGNQRLGTLDYEAERPYLDQIVELYEAHFNESDPVQRGEIYAEINRVAQAASEFAIPNEIDKLYNSMGASGLNAHTWHEETVYKVSLPSNRLEQWALIESDRFVDPVFRLFHTELETVYEEKNRTLDNRSRIIGTAVDELLFKEHPYGQQPTIGTVDHLKNPSLVYIRDYFDTYYVPNNMGIFISGDIDIEDTIELISEHFGDWESQPVPEVGPWEEEPINGVERTTVQYPGPEQVRIAFRTAPNGSEDQEALILLDMILDNRTAGLINLNLNQQQRVREAGSSPLFLNDYGVQNLYGVPKQGQTLAEVEQLLLEQLELVKQGEFENWILPAIINDFKKSEKASLEFNTSRVAMMRQAFIEGADWEDAYTELERMEQVTKQDVIDVANKYFGDDYVAVYLEDAQHEVPLVEKPPIDPVVIDPTRQSEFAETILAMDYEPIEPEYVQVDEDYRLVEFADGVELYYAPNPLNDLFSFSVYTEIGTEADEKFGMAAALMDLVGTENMSNEELQKEWYRMGSEFRFAAGTNATSISVSGLDDQFENSLALAMEVVKTPSAEPQTLEQLKAILLKNRQDQKNSPPAIAQALYLYNRYGEESPMLEAMTSDEIMATELEELLALPEQILNYRHTLSYTGSLPLEDVVEILRRHYPVASELAETPPYRFRRVRDVQETELKLVDQQTAQAQVRIEFGDGLFTEDDTVESSLYTSYFGSGMSSVVFQELREARALAYSASARYAQGDRLNDQNLVMGAIGTQTDKTVDALSAFLDLIDNMPQSAERFEETKNSLINRYRTSRLNFREVIGAVRRWEQLGLSGDPRRERYAELQETTMEDLLKFQQEHIAERPKIISVVGDLSIIDMEQLARFGSIEQVQVDQLFVE